MMRLFYCILCLFLLNTAFAEEKYVGSILIPLNGRLRWINIATGDIVDSNAHQIQLYSNASKISNDEFIFQKYNNSIGVYNIIKNKEDILVKDGRCPVYMENDNSFIFVSKNHDGSGAVFLRYNINTGKIAHASNMVFKLNVQCPIHVGDEKFLVNFAEGENPQIKIVNLSGGDFYGWAVGVKPVFFIGNKELLVKKNGDYYVANLYGEILKSVPEKYLNSKEMRPYAYIKEINSMLILEYREWPFWKQTANLWLLNMSTMEAYKIANKGEVTYNTAMFFSQVAK